MTIKNDVAEGIIVPTTEWQTIHFWIDLTDVYGHTVSSNNCTISHISVHEFSTNYGIAVFILLFGISVVTLINYRKKKFLKLK